jgi:hypothetical protein
VSAQSRPLCGLSGPSQPRGNDRAQRRRRLSSAIVRNGPQVAELSTDPVDLMTPSRGAAAAPPDAISRIVIGCANGQPTTRFLRAATWPPVTAIDGELGSKSLALPTTTSGRIDSSPCLTGHSTASSMDEQAMAVSKASPCSTQRNRAVAIRGMALLRRLRIGKTGALNVRKDGAHLLDNLLNSVPLGGIILARLVEM